jgi:predicted DCC family thiol-disulfide oxidoreductase YuxK
MTNSNLKTKKSIVFFDGVCNLCNSSVDFIIKRNKKKRDLFYCSLQSSKALNYLDQKDIQDLNTLVFLHNEKVYKKSTAVLKILLHLYGSSRILTFILKALLLLPKCIRDTLYKFISSNRYRLFGKRQSCRLPSQQEQDQFIG